MTIHHKRKKIHLNTKLTISGLVTGWVSSMFASGGGPIFSWLMQDWCEYDIKHVNGPSLIMLSAVASVGFSLRFFIDRTDVHPYIALTALLFGLPGVFLGKKLALWLNSARLREFFAIFLILVGIRMIGVGVFAPHVLSPTSYTPIVALAGFVAGFGSSLLGMGGGLVLVPIFTIYTGLSANQALATSLLASIPMMMLGAILYLIAHHVKIADLKYLLPPAIFGALMGAWISHHIPNGPLQMLFGIFLIFSASKTFLDTRVRFRPKIISPIDDPDMI